MRNISKAFMLHEMKKYNKSWASGVDDETENKTWNFIQMAIYQIYYLVSFSRENESTRNDKYCAKNFFLLRLWKRRL